MANVAHSTLTGANLHEPKGIAAATSGKVYISDGAGSGAWTATSTIPGVFGSQILHVRDEKTSGTNNTDIASANVWSTRTLNTTKTNSITSASLSSNQITLPAGTYLIMATTPHRLNSDTGPRGGKAKLYNVTDASDTVIGTTFALESNNSGTSVRGDLNSHINGVFTIAGSKVFDIRSICSGSGNVLAQGQSTTEVYTDVLIWKIA